MKNDEKWKQRNSTERERERERERYEWRGMHEYMKCVNLIKLLQTAWNKRNGRFFKQLTWWLGKEMNFEVDFLGHFLLTDLLLPAGSPIGCRRWSRDLMVIWLFVSQWEIYQKWRIYTIGDMDFPFLEAQDEQTQVVRMYRLIWWGCESGCHMI